ncbi:MAG: DUF4097 domain-containing protein [Lachnospiraceae bacterium]|nr:DUF4097 domain-containing protein [Lachnospiraceae bacterium]
MDFFNSKLIERNYVCHGRIDHIQITGSSEKIIVEGRDVENVMLSYLECPGKQEFTLIEQNGTLTLEKKNIRSILWLLYQPFIDNGIKVVVPRGFNGTLEIDSSSGRIVVSDLNAENMSIRCSSGAIKVEQIGIGNLCIESSSGAVKTESINTGNLSINTSSGAIRIDNVNSRNNINVGCSSGMITLVDSTAAGNISLGSHSGLTRLIRVSAGGSVTAGNTSGGIHFESLKTGGNIDFSTMSGAIRGSILGRQSDYSIISHTTTGHNGIVNSRTGAKEMNISTTAGAIKVSFLE